MGVVYIYTPHPLTSLQTHFLTEIFIYLFGLYTPAFLYTSEAIGTVEFTGFEITPNIALGQLLLKQYKIMCNKTVKDIYKLTLQQLQIILIL